VLTQVFATQASPVQGLPSSQASGVLQHLPPLQQMPWSQYPLVHWVAASQGSPSPRSGWHWPSPQ
jgi:hypothetical protein